VAAVGVVANALVGRLSLSGTNVLAMIGVLILLLLFVGCGVGRMVTPPLSFLVLLIPVANSPLVSIPSDSFFIQSPPRADVALSSIRRAIALLRDRVAGAAILDIPDVHLLALCPSVVASHSFDSDSDSDFDFAHPFVAAAPR